MSERDKERLSLIPVLAESHPSHHIGRTALMKYMYFLQTLRGVQLGYNFSMYSYGPFDADVLSEYCLLDTGLLCWWIWLQDPTGGGSSKN